MVKPKLPNLSLCLLTLHFHCNALPPAVQSIFLLAIDTLEHSTLHEANSGEKAPALLRRKPATTTGPTFTGFVAPSLLPLPFMTGSMLCSPSQ